MNVSTGAVLTSKSGRTLSPAPKIDCTSDRKAANSIKRLHAWMKMESLNEVAGNEYLTLMLSRFNPDRLTTCEGDVLNDVLFGGA